MKRNNRQTATPKKVESMLSNDAQQVKTEISEALEPWRERPPTLEASITRYFERSDSALVARIEALVETLPSMAADVQAVACVPVVAFGNQDTRALLRTLRRLNEAAAGGAGITEVLVLSNWPRRQTADGTTEAARQFEGRNIKVLVAPVELAPHEQNAGYYRTLMHGIVLMRTLRRGQSDVVHITLDADTVSLPAGYIQGYITALVDGAVGAVVGQLDWDNETVPTARVPELFIGNELMRLLPKHGNWRILARPDGYGDELHQECVFSRRSFGRGVQANLAWRGQTYARVGGYRPEPHDELDFILRKIGAVGDLRNLAFLWKPVAILSDSRRALWALKDHGMPPMRQWAVPFTADDTVRRALPDLAEHVGHVSTGALERQINLTLEAFNLPREALQAAVIASLAEMGLGYEDYDLSLVAYEPDPVLALAQICLHNDTGLRARIQRS
ncbi:MAG: hypothetical protein HY461_02880 [Parcubacteria group bacterium]|nr:hypothetical protein [Parcubacteria group bacterium]